MYDAGGLLATRDLGLVVLQGATLGGGTVINYTTSFARRRRCGTSGLANTSCRISSAKNSNVALHKVANRLGVNPDHANPIGTRSRADSRAGNAGLASRAVAARRARVPAG
jgi:hypothetical protein